MKVGELRKVVEDFYRLLEEHQTLHNQSMDAITFEYSNNCSTLREQSRELTRKLGGLRDSILMFSQNWLMERMGRQWDALTAAVSMSPLIYKDDSIGPVLDKLSEFLGFLESKDEDALYSELFVNSIERKSEGPFVSENRIMQLRAINSSQFNLVKLIKLVEELNSNFSNKNYFSTAMLVRSIVDHVPPIFAHNCFKDVAAQCGSRSFKDSMNHLDKSLRKIADSYLHTGVRSKESLPEEQQVKFYSDLDVLLAEVVRLLS